MIKIGLTGSMGMGKTTTGKVFEKLGCAVWNADKATHKLYSKGGKAVTAVAKLFPSSVENGSISRSKLKILLRNDPDKLRDLENAVHPLVLEDRQNFQSNTKKEIVVFDIPLLFETGADKEMHKTVCVFTTYENQLKRLKNRNHGTEEYFKELLSKQMPSNEKCERSDYLIETTTLTLVEKRVNEILNEIKTQNHA